MTIEELNEELYFALNEMATIYRDPKLSIIVNPDAKRNFYRIEYFKVFHGDNFRKATDIARIYFRDAKYEIHNSGKENFKLNTKDKKQLIEIFNLPSRMYDNYLIWHDCILQFNNEAYGLSFKDGLKLTQEYLNSLEDADPVKKYLPIDTPIPDYMKL